METTQVPPHVLRPKQEAAMMLGISIRGLDYLIARKEVKTVLIGKRRMVPHSEIERIAKQAR